MRLRFIWTGKTKDARLKALCEDYLKRLSHFVRSEVIEVRESKGGSASEGIEKDSKRISDALHEGTLVVLLDPAGVNWSSKELASQMQRWSNEGVRELSFVIGGPQGVSKELAAKANKCWALSRLTFTHEMARVLVLEQVYRAFTIIHGLPYQK
ncbi:MAG TPA: 23S rRNA (pseudouridine(1915)-N(3))-methyltransferase RlmH [Pyrinomonadaceae bacterium]|nr:23S rRNA (pseudouridine(1915)-N(3))-methyltransferase RlmH [Pyrinomonadaceae bacterium]